MKQSSTKTSLKKHSLAPHKRFGQNFLVNRSTAQSIVNCGSVSSEDSIIEVGVGLGALTIPLAKIAKEVIGIEVDSGIIRYHEEEMVLPENVRLIHGDILKTDFSLLSHQVGSKLKIVANLPYSISNPFLFSLVDNRKDIDWVVVMLQKEVAERLLSQPSTKQYGIPTVLLSAYTKIEKLLSIKPHEFHPQPKVDSLVIRIDFLNTPPYFDSYPSLNHTLFQKTVRCLFAQRRKNILNNMVNMIYPQVDNDKKSAKKLAHSLIEDAGFSHSERAENLALQDFITLTHHLQQTFGLEISP